MRAKIRRPHKAGIGRPARSVRIRRRRLTTRKGRVPRLPVTLYNNLHKPKLITTLRYCDTKTISPGASSAVHTFRLNSIYDPDLSGIGHKPAYTDQWNGLYTKYRVLWTKYKVSFSNKRGTYLGQLAGTGPGAGDVYPAGDTSHFNQLHNCNIVAVEANGLSTPQLLETGDKNFLRETSWSNKLVKWKFLGGNETTIKTIQGYAGMPTLYQNIDNYRRVTAFTTNPTDEASNGIQGNLHVVAISKDGTTASSVRFDITIDYVVELSEPVNIGES